MECDDAVLKQQEAIRRSGATNTVFMQEVKLIANECGFHALVGWIEAHGGGEYIDMASKAARRFGPDTYDGDLPETPEEVTLERTVEMN